MTHCFSDRYIGESRYSYNHFEVAENVQFLECLLWSIELSVDLLNVQQDIN